jgi:glutathione S-transferase
MITLYGFGPFFGLPDASPYVMKTEVQLRMAGLAYRKDLTGYPAAPKGKLPYIDDAGTIVADSTFIRAHVEKTRGIDLDAGLDPFERATAWAIERMLEDHLGWTSGYFRWLVPENFDKGPARFFDGLPEAVRDEVREDTRREVAARFWGQGMGRHAPAEVAYLGGRSLRAFSAMLDDKPFVGGSRPCGTDATAFAMLATILAPHFDTALRRRAEALPNLVDYTARMMRRYFPGHPWQGEGEAANDAWRLSA